MSRKLHLTPIVAILLLALIASAAAPAWAARSEMEQQAAAVSGGLAQVGQIGGVTTTVAADAGMLYFNVGPRMARMDASTPSAPVLPPTFGDILPGIPEDIEVANGFLYVAMGDNGVAIVSASTLELVDAVKLPNDEFAYAVAVGPQRLYVAAGDSGIVSYAIGAAKNVLTDAQTKTLSPFNAIKDVAVVTSGPNVYLYSGGEPEGVARFDITTVFLPTTAVNAPAANISALQAADGYIYAAADTGLNVYDAAALTLTGSVSTDPGLIDLALVPTAHTLYAINTDSQIETLDVSDPAAPSQLNTDPFVPVFITAGIAAVSSGGSYYLYSADYESGLSIAAAPDTEPEDLDEESPSYFQSDLASTQLVAGARRQALVAANFSHLTTVDNSVPANLAQVGSSITSNDMVLGLAAKQNILLAAGGSDGLLRYQFTPGGAPTADGVFDTDGFAYDTAFAWPNALVADSNNGLLVVNIDGVMSLTGSVPAPEAESDFHLVDAQGSLAVVYDGMAGASVLRLYDLSNPAAPVAKGTLAQEGVLDLQINGKYVLLACGDAGVKVVDITDPTAPALVGDGFDTPGFAIGLAAMGSSLYVADYNAGVHALAIQPDGSLVLKGTLDTAGNALQVSPVYQDYLYIADDTGGLVIMRASALGPYFNFMPSANH